MNGDELGVTIMTTTTTKAARGAKKTRTPTPRQAKRIREKMLKSARRKRNARHG
jgi:hypothetical protein